MRKKILVIDDDQAAFSLIKNTVGPHGCEVFFASDPEKSISMTSEIAPDLILINLMLHESNGLKVSKSIHSTSGLNEIPILMMISFPGELDPKYTRTIGVVDVIVKPLAEKELLTKALGLLGKGDESEEFETLPVESPEDKKRLVSQDDEWSNEFDLEVQKFEETEKTPEDEFSLSEDDGSKSREEMFKIEEEEIAEHFREADIPEVREGNTDNIADYDLEGDIMEPHARSEKDVLNGPVMSGSSYPIEDEAERNASSEAVEMPQQTPEKSSKKALFAGLALIAVLGLGAGAFFANKTFYSGTGGPANSAIKPAPVPPKEPVKEVTASEGVKPTREKTAEGVPAASTEKNSLVPGPVASVPAPSAEEQKTAAVTSQSEKVKKTPDEKKETKAEKGRDAYTYSAQAGVFDDEKNADALAAKLKQNGFDAFVVRKEPQTSKGKVVHRVLIGKFDNNKKVIEQIKLLKKEGVDSVLYRY